jgi:hypothetical protein
MTPLYKFIANPIDVQFILRGSLKFTPIPELNDPSELLANVILEDVEQSLERICNHGYTDEDMANHRRQAILLRKLAPDLPVIPVPETKENAADIVRSAFSESYMPLLVGLLEAIAQEVSSKVGLLCLTKTYASLPMWAYYAGNAAGLAVEFRDLSEAFSGDETGLLGKLVPVRYEREILGVTFDPRSHESLFFSKFQDWDHEQEVRVVIPLADCRQIPNGERQLYLFDVPSQHIARIILGWKMAQERIDAVVERVQSINPDVEVVKARIEGGKIRCGEALNR